MMLSQCGKVRLGNFVDPKYTMGAAIPKKYIAWFFLPELDVFSKDLFQIRHLWACQDWIFPQLVPISSPRLITKFFVPFLFKITLVGEGFWWDWSLVKAVWFCFCQSNSVSNDRNRMLFIVVLNRDFSLINSQTSEYAFSSTVPIVSTTWFLLSDCWLGANHPRTSLGLWSERSGATT